MIVTADGPQTNGNVKEKSIYEIWNDDVISKIRQDHLNGKRNEINPCNKCGVEFNWN